MIETHDVIADKAREAVKVLDELESLLTKGVLEYISSKEKYRSIRHRVRSLRDELKEDIVRI